MKKLLSFFLAVIMLTTCALADYSDMPGENSWCHDALEFAVESGLLTGTADGKMNPNGSLTRTQMAAIVARLFGAKEAAEVSEYSDLTTDFQRQQFGFAVQMGVFGGYSDGTMRPNQLITREQAFAVLARSLLYLQDEDAGAELLVRYTDADQVGAWARNALCALTENGYISGNNGRLNPKGTITRAQFAQFLYHLFGQIIAESGTYTSVQSGNVIVRCGNVTLQNLTVTGDLILADGVNEDDVTLNNVTVNGRVIIRGGGSNTVKVTGSTTVGGGVSVCKTTAPVHIVWQSTASNCAPNVTVFEGCRTVTVTGSFAAVYLEGDDLLVDAKSATLQKGVISGDNSEILIEQGSTLQHGEIEAECASSKITIIQPNGTEKEVTGKTNRAVIYEPTTTTDDSSPTLTWSMVQDLAFYIELGGTWITNPASSQTIAGKSTSSYTAQTSTIDLRGAAGDTMIRAGKITATLPGGQTVYFNPGYNNQLGGNGQFRVGQEYTITDFLTGTHTDRTELSVGTMRIFLNDFSDSVALWTERTGMQCPGTIYETPEGEAYKIVVRGSLSADGYSGSLPYSLVLLW